MQEIFRNNPDKFLKYPKEEQTRCLLGALESLDPDNPVKTCVVLAGLKEKYLFIQEILDMKGEEYE